MATKPKGGARKPTRRPRRKVAVLPLLTRRELAAALSIGKQTPTHPQTISKWLEEGMPVAERGRGGRPSRYDELEVRAWLAARNEAQRDGEPTHALKERARKERAQAQLAEQLFAMRAGTLLKVEDVDRLIQAEQTAVRSKLLAMPTTHADRVHRVAVLEGAVGVERVLRDTAYEILRELADPARILTPQGEPTEGEDEGDEDGGRPEEDDAAVAS